MNRRTFLKTVIIGGAGVATGAIVKVIDALGSSEMVEVTNVQPELGVFEGFTIYDEFSLNPYQEEMLTWTDAKRVVWMGGRRSGKSYASKVWSKNYSNCFNKAHRPRFTRKLP